ncbi:MAG: serine hydrolase [Acidobacteria bacterium]|nr:serine hydrolase [Acidobacteriota bacterium]
MNSFRRYVVVASVLLGVASVTWISVAGATVAIETAPAFESVVKRVAELPRMRSLLVSVDGRLQVEQYFHGAAGHRAANLKSASKSIISLLVGIALDRGDIESLDTPIREFFPEYLDDPEKGRITVEDLLTMRAGLETTSNRNYGRWVQSSNWVKHVLTRPLVATPGTEMIYSTGSTHLLSAIITKASGMDTHRFAQRYLAEPMGISVPRWTVDPQGVFFGGNEMSLTPRDMLAIGEMYLNCGRVGTRQIVSEEWVHSSIRTHATRDWRPERTYGYGWWVREVDGHDAFYAWGYGGQFIYVVPGLRLVAVMTSSPDPGEGLRAHRQSLYDLMEEEIVPAVAAGV